MSNKITTTSSEVVNHSPKDKKTGVEKSMARPKKAAQTNLFGEFVEQEKEPLEFVKVYEEVVNEGDQFTMNLGVAKYNDEKDCITVIDSEKNQALTVYFEQHPSSKFQSMPEGIRLGKAVQRALKQTIADGETLAHSINDNDMTLSITHTGTKGRLWVVA
jgi:hypothetical protein